MRSRRLAAAAIALPLLAAALWWLRAPPQGSTPPNILLVSIDSLRPDHLHCYGYPRPTSPAIDRLAQEGALFRTVVSPTSWTLPAHVTLLSALPPVKHGVIKDDRAIGERTILLSTVLRDAGYATAGFAAGPYLASTFGFARGFDHYDDSSVAVSDLYASHHGVTSPASFEIATRWLEAWKESSPRKPFFVFLHLWDVHYDYAPPPPYDAMFDPDYRGSVNGRDFATSLEIHADMDRRDLEHVIALYDGEIRYTDEYLGRLIERLRAMELLDDTIVAVTSDHGDEFFEHGKKGHGNHLYDETVLVPLVLRHPATIPAGTVVEQQARLMDVAPTLLALAGMAPPPGFGAMAGASHTARDLSSRWRTAGRETAPPAFGELRGEWASVRTESAKLIRYLGPEARRLSRRRRAAAMQAQLAEMERAHVPSASLLRALVADLQTEDKLFDLGADPREQSPLADRPELRQRLLEEIEAWRKEWSAEPNLSTETAIDPAVRERLRKLGYL